MASPEKKAVRPEKAEAVELLKQKFSGASGIFLADFTGLTVAEASDLRRRCREAQVEYRVIKNTLAKLAAREADIAELEEHFQGPVAVAQNALASVYTSFASVALPIPGRLGFTENITSDPTWTS